MIVPWLGEFLKVHLAVERYLLLQYSCHYALWLPSSASISAVSRWIMPGRLFPKHLGYALWVTVLFPCPVITHQSCLGCPACEVGFSLP